MELNRTWSIGKGESYVRFYPNPGFCFRLFGNRFQWSKHRGWTKKRKVKRGSIR